jgi:hypothetical protein
MALLYDVLMRLWEVRRLPPGVENSSMYDSAGAVTYISPRI